MLPAAIAAGRVPAALTSLNRPRSWQRLAAPVVCVALTALGWPAFASAAGTTVIVAAGVVDTAANAGACTTTGSAVSCPNLRDAVAYANAGTAGLDPTIELGAGTSELSLGPLEPAISMTIAGAGDVGGAVSTIQQVGSSAVVSATAPLTLKDLIVTGGDAIGAAGTSASPNGGSVSGGGIVTSSDLTLTGVSVTGNVVFGGAGYSETGGTDGGVGGSAQGAAIDDTGSSAVVTLTDSSITANTATGGNGGTSDTGEGGFGGSALSAIDVAGTVDATGSSISSNVAMGGSGGSDGITGNFQSGGGGEVGAAIMAVGVSLTATSVSGNVATGGDGGLASGPAAFGGPGGMAFGGGIEAGDQLTITSSVVSGNRAIAGNGGAASGAGGTGGGAAGALGAAAAFFSPSGVVGITDSTISGNISSGGVPGVGLAQAGPSGGSFGALSVIGGQVEISGSTISGNEAVAAGGALGGGLYLSRTAATIVNSTVFGNTAQAGPAGTPVIEGGGIYASVGASVLLSSDTIAGNTAAPATLHPLGANLYGDGTATYTLQDTAIAAPLPAGVANCSFGEAPTDDGHNLEDSSPSTCGLTTAGGDQIGSPAGLPPALGANGGTAVAATSLTPAIPATLTLAPASGSPLLGNGGSCTDPLAIEAASAPFPPLTVDERGDPRPATCDIGAYQSQPLTVSGAPSIPSSATVGESLTCASGTFATSGDGALTASGAVGAPMLTYTWASTGIQVATGQTYLVGAGDAGHTLTCTETATGAYGHGSATSSGALVSAPASSTGATTPASSTGATIPTGAGGTTGTTKTTGTSATLKLTIGAVAQAHTRWTLTKSKGLPVGTSFAYTLTEKANVTLTFTTRRAGRRTGGRCVAKTKRNAHDRACQLMVDVGTLTGSGKAGLNTVSFTGDIGRRALTPGAYVVTITAKASGIASSKTLGFTIAPATTVNPAHR